MLKPSGSMFVNLGDKYAGSGGNNQSGVGEKAQNAGPSSYNKASDGIPAKSLMMLPQRYAIGCIDQLGLILRAEIIWAKPNGLPESVTDRVRRSHEQWFHMTKEPRYFSAVDEIREPQLMTGGQDFRSPNASGNGRTHRSMSADESLYNPLGKLPGSVWTVPTEPLRVPDHLGVDHFAAFPSEWPRRLILGWSPSGVCLECGEGRRPVVAKELEHVNNSAHTKSRAGAALSAGHRTTGATNVAREHATITGYACACPDTTAPTRPAVILDPFTGTGTVPAVAHALGRHGIGIDLSADYLRLAEWRINHSGLVSKTRDDYLTKGGAAAAEAVIGADDEAAVPTVLDFG